MLNISNEGIIEISLGDSVKIPLFINQGNKLNLIRYTILKDPGATIHFGVRRITESFECACIKKIYTARSNFSELQDVVISIEPEDTLKLLPGKYFYSVKISRPLIGGYNMTTIIADKPFIIKE